MNKWIQTGRFAAPVRWLNKIYYSVLADGRYRIASRKALGYYRDLKDELKAHPALQERLNLYIQPTWQNQLDSLNFEAGIPWDFLMLPMSRRMFYKSKQQIEYYKQDMEQRKIFKIVKGSLANFFEPRAGLMFGWYSKIDFLNFHNISPNTAASLYQLSMFNNLHPLKPGSTIVEFGAGYGSLANIVATYLNYDLTYVCIDLPEMLALQYNFLLACLGEDRVSRYSDNNQRIQNGKINLVPVYRINEVGLKADMFISTFALTESSVCCQEEMAKKGYFGAEYFYLVGHEAPPEEGQEEKWDSINLTESRVRAIYKFCTSEPYPQINCFQLFAKI